MSVHAGVLASIPFFSGLDESDVLVLAQASVSKVFFAKQQILQGNVLFQHLLVVVSGQVQSMELSAEGKLLGLSQASEGDTIGWLSIIDEQPIQTHLVAKTNAELIFVPAQLARNLVTARPVITKRVLNGLALNIRRLTAERFALAQPNAYQRIFVHILNFAGNNSDPTKPATLPKQHEIAVMANTSRETVSRAMQLLVKKGIIKKEGHTVVVQNKPVLEQLAHDGPGSLPVSSS